MAYYPKYNKNKKSKKAFIGAAASAVLPYVPSALTALKGFGKKKFGKNQMNRAKEAMDNFDKSTLEGRVSEATQQMADEPIDQSYIERLEQQQGASQASAMDALKRDPRNTLAGVQALSQQAGNQRTEMLGLQQDARTKALTNLAKEQQTAETRRQSLVDADLAGIKAEMKAGEENKFSGIEDIMSGGSSAAGILNESLAKEGGKIDDDGGVTPGEFDHNSNPIDMVQDGEKIGEATGGELILPPDDVEEIRLALSDGDKNAAFELMKSLVEKYDSNVIESEQEAPSQEEPSMEQGPMMKNGGYLSTISARMGAYLNRR